MVKGGIIDDSGGIVDDDGKIVEDGGEVVEEGCCFLGRPLSEDVPFLGLMSNIYNKHKKYYIS